MAPHYPLLPTPLPPSLLLHTHSLHHLNSSPYPTAATSMSALDHPCSATWLHLPLLHSPPFPLCSSTSNPLLYTFSSSQLSFSSEPLHLPSPAVWCIDPVVALVSPGLLVVVARGVSKFEDDPLAVEVFDCDWWIPARSMPDAFKHSGSAYYLSATVACGRLHVVERRSGLTSSFDPVKDMWSKPLDPLVGVEPRPLAIAVTPASDKLVVVGIMGWSAEVAGVTLWEVRGETDLVEIGEMPTDMVGRFMRGSTRGSTTRVSEVEVRVAEASGHVYVYNPSRIGEVFYWSAGPGGYGEWRCNPTRSMVITVAAVRMDDIREALQRCPLVAQD